MGHQFPNCISLQLKNSPILTLQIRFKKNWKPNNQQVFMQVIEYDKKDGHWGEHSLQTTQILKTNNVSCTSRLDNAWCKIFEKHSRTDILICSTWEIQKFHEDQTQGVPRIASDKSNNFFFSSCCVYKHVHITIHTLKKKSNIYFAFLIKFNAHVCDNNFQIILILGAIKNKIIILKNNSIKTIKWKKK